MTLAVIRSRALDGLQAPPVQVEVHLANGLPSFTLLVCQLDSCETCINRASVGSQAGRHPSSSEEPS